MTLESEEREHLAQFLSPGKADVRRLKHARILLKSHESEGGPAWSDSRIAKAVDCGTATVERVRQRFVEEGLEPALSPYRHADQLVPVMDRLDTHAAASLYEAFPPAEAKRIADLLEIHHAPKHGSRLNMAEMELSAAGRQRLSRRIARQGTLAAEVTEWVSQGNRRRSTVHWQFTTKDARIKLRRLYPSFQD